MFVEVKNLQGSDVKTFPKNAICLTGELVSINKGLEKDTLRTLLGIDEEDDIDTMKEKASDYLAENHIFALTTSKEQKYSQVNNDLVNKDIAPLPMLDAQGEPVMVEDIDGNETEGLLYTLLVPREDHVVRAIADSPDNFIVGSTTEAEDLQIEKFNVKLNNQLDKVKVAQAEARRALLGGSKNLSLSAKAKARKLAMELNPLTLETNPLVEETVAP